MRMKMNTDEGSSETGHFSWYSSEGTDTFWRLSLSGEITITVKAMENMLSGCSMRLISFAQLWFLDWFWWWNIGLNIHLEIIQGLDQFYGSCGLGAFLLISPFLSVLIISCIWQIFWILISNESLHIITHLWFVSLMKAWVRKMLSLD